MDLRHCFATVEGSPRARRSAIRAAITRHCPASFFTIKVARILLPDGGPIEPGAVGILFLSRGNSCATWYMSTISKSGASGLRFTFAVRTGPHWANIAFAARSMFLGPIAFSPAGPSHIACSEKTET